MPQGDRGAIAPPRHCVTMTRREQLVDDLGYLLAHRWLNEPKPQKDDAAACEDLRGTDEDATSERQRG